MMFTVSGFPRDGSAADKIKVEMVVSLRDDRRLRAKSGPPPTIAKYLADFISKTVAEVEPRFTHTKMTKNPGMTRSEAREFRQFCEQATNMQCLNIHAEEKKRAKHFAGTDQEEYYEECRDIAREVCEERGLL
jgi:hypothetical protein